MKASRELAELGRPLDREWIGALALRQPSARGGDAGDGPGHRPREEKGDDGREDGADQSRDREPDQEGLPVVGLIAGRAEEHDRVAASQSGGVQERLAANVDGAVGAPARTERLRGRGREEKLGLLGRQDRQPLLLGREEAAERRFAARQRGGRVLGDDEVDLPIEGAAGVVVERATGERRADREHHDRRHGQGRGDADEQPGPQRAGPVQPAHATALYPEPRTVRIRSGRSSFLRNCAT